MPPTHSDNTKIAEAAYFLWQKEGCPEGRDKDHWDRAKAALSPGAKPRKPRAKAAGPAVTKKAAAPKKAAARKPRKKPDA